MACIKNNQNDAVLYQKLLWNSHLNIYLLSVFILIMLAGGVHKITVLAMIAARVYA